jgi:IS6 family transposase
LGLSSRDVEELLAERGVDETSVKVAGRWRYSYRAIGQFGQVIDLFVSPRAGGVAPGGVASHRSVRQHHIEADHGHLKSRLLPMRGLKQDHSAKVVIAGHAFTSGRLRRAPVR